MKNKYDYFDENVEIEIKDEFAKKSRLAMYFLYGCVASLIISFALSLTYIFTTSDMSMVKMVLLTLFSLVFAIVSLALAILYRSKEGELSLIPIVFSVIALIVSFITVLVMLMWVATSF